MRASKPTKYSKNPDYCKVFARSRGGNGAGLRQGVRVESGPCDGRPERRKPRGCSLKRLDGSFRALTPVPVSPGLPSLALKGFVGVLDGEEFLVGEFLKLRAQVGHLVGMIARDGVPVGGLDLLW